MSLTNIKDLDHELMMKMEDESLLNFCKINNKYVQKLCDDENFWRNKTHNKFGLTIEKLSNRTWKDFYLKIIYYMNKYSIFQAAAKLKKDIKNYDIYYYFSKLVTDRIREVILTELRMDYDQNNVSKKEEVILFNERNINRAVDRIYREYLAKGKLSKLEHQPTINNLGNIVDGTANFYRDYLCDDLDEDILMLE